MAKRITAILGAVALILIAVGVRGVLNKDDDKGGPSNHGKDGKPVVACTPDLQSICDALSADGLIEGTDPIDLDAAADPTKVAKLDGWITWDPAPDMIDAGRNAGPLWGDSKVVFDSQLTFSTNELGRDHLSDTPCSLGKASVLSCLGGVAVDGTVTLGVGSPTTAEGLARFGLFGVGFVDEGGTADGGSLEDIFDNGGESGTALASLNAQTQRALGADVVVAPRALAENLSKTARGRQEKLRPIPLAGQYLSVVLVGREGVDLGDLAGKVPEPAKSAADALGLAAGDHKSAIDPGKLYVVWKALS